MATYYHGNSEIQGDGLQTLILMNPGYVGYSDAQQQHAPPQGGNFVFLNSAGNSISHQTQQFVGIPLPSPATSQDPNAPPTIHGHHEMSGLHGYMPRVSYNLWNSIDTRDTQRGPQQGLSLSLSSQHAAYTSSTAISPAGGGGGGCGGDDLRVSGASSSSASGISNGGVSGMQSVLLSSKYLKAAQVLLDEVVNVNSGLKTETLRGSNGLSKIAGESSSAAGETSMAAETNSKRSPELTTGERQEIQMKKAKLVSMLDEVEQRYRQYHHQMHIVITSFEQAAGIGSASTYTALALQTISKQFRCLKDAISGQIRAASRSLGEEDGSGGKEGSRLKFVDHQIRQQRALQQLGMIQHNAWRPQRGLPERSVSVLRAWLFEHFLHPYPKDSDKHMLAKKTGLTRSQVSNWFINARVRLWKPMVEEMYKEEVKEHEQNGSDDKTSKAERDEDSGSQEKSLNTSKQDNPKTQTSHSSIPISITSTSPIGGNLRNPPSFTLIGSPVIDGYDESSPKKPRNTNVSPSRIINPEVKPNDTNNTEEGFIKFGDERQSRDGYSIMTGPTNFISGFGSYPMGDMGRFDTEQYTPRFSGNAVSLTLGLPHCENLSLSANHQTFLPSQSIQLGRGVEIGNANEFVAMNTPTSTHATPVYDAINIQNRKRFAAQLLPDFVT